MKMFDLSKPHFFLVSLTFIDDITLNSDNNKEIEVLDFAGLCWPSLAFLALDNFLKQKLAFADKN